MENVISARRLRKSVLNSSGEIDLDLYNLDRNKHVKYKQNKKESVSVNKLKTRMIVKMFLCSVVLFCIIVSKMFFLEEVKNNNTIVRLYYHYSTDFSKCTILDKLEYRLNKIDLIIGNIVPEKIKDYSKTKYFDVVKPYILQFDLRQTFNQIIELDNSKDNKEIIEEKEIEIINKLESENIETGEDKTNSETPSGVGGAEPLIEQTEQALSSISIMDIDVELIKAKKISMIKPVNGVVTSRYGVREEIFAGVNPYHTGIDIANKSGTSIFSATKGKVTKVEYKNKYYGNYVEITEDGVIFKYAHLDSINVKDGSIVNQKDIIGLMGSTGMSTGPHLHFEIRINNRTVNPEELIVF